MYKIQLDEKEKIKEKEQKSNPGGIFNDAVSRSFVGSPNGGCVINIISIFLLIAILLLIRACTLY